MPATWKLTTNSTAAHAKRFINRFVKFGMPAVECEVKEWVGPNNKYVVITLSGQVYTRSGQNGIIVYKYEVEHGRRVGKRKVPTGRIKCIDFNESMRVAKSWMAY